MARKEKSGTEPRYGKGGIRKERNRGVSCWGDEKNSVCNRGPNRRIGRASQMRKQEQGKRYNRVLENNGKEEICSHNDSGE